MFEALAYFAGFRLYLRERRQKGDFLAAADRIWLVAMAIAGAAAGSKLLYWLEDPFQTWTRWNDLAYLMGGKTIVGGLLGGTLAVEWSKRRMGIVRRTGDLYAVPLAAGMAIGRIGCFFGGLGDKTYGLATALPWGVDFGDGPRHPTQLYEAGLLLAGAAVLRRVQGEEGDRFRMFLTGYLLLRLVVDFLKPGVALGGLTAIQWACGAGILHYRRDWLRWLGRGEAAAAHG